MIEGEKTQFNGNLALLRVCAIIFVISVCNIITSMFFTAGQSGALASMWRTITTSSFEDYLATGGLLIASGMAFPIGLGVLTIVATLTLGILALVKKNVTALKIVAVIMIIWNFTYPLLVGSLGEYQNFPSLVVGAIINANLVVAVAAFFVAPKKRVEDNGIVTHEGFNLGLYRFCAVFFLVNGLSGTMGTFMGFAFFLSVILFSFFAVVTSIFALVKKNTDILMVCALVMVVQIIWKIFQVINMSNFGFFWMANSLIHSVFNALTVVCVATFFIEPERTRNYFNKVKSLFVKWKEMT